MSTIVKALWYAGLEKEELEPLLPEAREENGRYLSIYSSMTVLIFAICLLVSVVAGGKLVVNRPIYTIMIVSGFALYFCARLTLRRWPAISTLLAALYIVALYGYSFTVSLLHPDMQGVAAVAILLVMPSLFNYRPIYMITMTIGAQAVYCLLSARLKQHDIAMLDLWNCLFFGSIAVLLSVYQMRVKFRHMLQKRENRYLSQTDLLTGAKNRNCFEESREQYAESCREGVACVFADANGLHELNDVQGHAAGDEMLKTVAAAMIRRFGQENTYRIGGDEFVAFCVDTPAEKLQKDIREIGDTIAAAGYSVSLGYAAHGRDSLDMRQLLKDAEGAMYAEKRRFYQQSGHDRRKRSMDS